MTGDMMAAAKESAACGLVIYQLTCPDDFQKALPVRWCHDRI